MNYSAEATNFWNSIIAWLPRLLGVIGVLIIGFIIAIILQRIVTAAVRRLGLDQRLERSPAHNVVRKLTTSPSETLGKFVYWLLVIVTLTIAISVMNIPVLNQLIAGIYGYVPNILAAILILGLAIAASTAVSVVVTRLMGDTATGKVVAAVIPAIVISIAGFAILEQLKIAPSIVLSTYIAIVGSLGLGLALAFGLGGVDASRRILDQAYNVGKQNMRQVKQDFQKGKERGKEQSDEAKRKLEES